MRRVCFFVFLFLSAAHADPSRYLTSVAPLPNEDMADACRYELMIEDPSREVRAVFVIFDRGRDILRIYNHLEVSSFVQHSQIALLMPFHCPERPGNENDKPGHDMDMDPTHGLGRALFTALKQFAQTTNHPELASSKLIFLGFSGTGSLVARMIAYAPDRVVASISTAPGHWDPLGINTVELPSDAMVVPQLIIANSEDKVSGTDRPYQYFRKYYAMGAPMALIIQNGVPHCCIVNAEQFITSWLEEVIQQRKPAASRPLRAMDQKTGLRLFLKLKETGTRDSWGQTTSAVTGATVQSVKLPAPGEYLPAGWLPTHKLASNWQAFVQQAQHPTTSLP